MTDPNPTAIYCTKRCSKRAYRNRLAERRRQVTQVCHACGRTIDTPRNVWVCALCERLARLACLSKAAFDSIAHAAAAAKAGVVVPCTLCGSFHLTSAEKSNSKTRKITTRLARMAPVYDRLRERYEGYGHVRFVEENRLFRQNIPLPPDPDEEEPLPPADSTVNHGGGTDRD